MALNKMKMGRGIFGCISYNGFGTDVLKSGFQKYCRRCDLDKMVYCVLEMNKFMRMDKSIGIGSNLRNRLCIILCEDISYFDDFNIFTNVDKEIKKWEKNRKEGNERECVRSMVSICKSMDRCDRVRINSYYRCVYKNCIEDKYFKEKLNDLYSGLEGDVNFDASRFFKVGDTEKTQRLVRNFVYYFLNENDKCFYYMFKILDLEKNECGKRGRKSKSCFVVWEILREFVDTEDKKEVFEVLYDWYVNYNNSRNENVLYMMSCLNMLMRSDIDWEKENVIDTVSDDEIDKYTRLGEEVMEMDEFVVDMHCVGVKMDDAGVMNFLDEGSFVNRLSVKYNNKLYGELYRDYKIRNMKVPEKKKMKKKYEKMRDNLKCVNFADFGDIELCREKVCGGKVMCVFGEYKGKKVVLKEMRKSFNYGNDCIVYNKMKKYIGLNYVRMSLIKSDKVVVKTNLDKKSWVNNWNTLDKECIYLVMEKFENVGSLVENKNLRKNENIKKDFMLNLLFRGVFGISDSNYTNVLVGTNGKLLSIDENYIRSDRKIFGKNVKLYKSVYDNEYIMECVLELKDMCRGRLHKMDILLKKYEYDLCISKKIESLKDDVIAEYCM